jgi:hypothetical protein
MNTPLSLELIQMAKEDVDVRREFSDDGAMYNRYHPRMKAVHDRNAKRLSSIVDEFGWPGKSLVGTEAASAAWIILQHAIAHPELQRRCFPMLVQQVEQGEISPLEMAMLEDRIRCFEGRPQRFGTQFDWDHNKQMSPLPLDDFDLVQQRRKKLGMRSIEEETEFKRKEAGQSNEKPPENYRAYLAEKEAWLKANGWRK